MSVKMYYLCSSTYLKVHAKWLVCNETFNLSSHLHNKQFTYVQSYCIVPLIFHQIPMTNTILQIHIFEIGY